jgi:hypothetical protein
MKGFSQKVFFSFVVSISIAFSAEAAPRMARVVEVRDSRTIVVQSGQQRIDITLAGVAPLDRVRSVDFLRWTLAQSWVMLEESPDQPGAHLVYRSPDGLFINREYVLRGFADPTLPGITPDSQTQVTYLGEVNPGQRRATEVAKGDRSKRAAAAAKSSPRSGPPTTTPRTTTRTARSRQ